VTSGQAEFPREVQMIVRKATLLLTLAACDAGPATPPPAAPVAARTGGPVGEPPPLAEEPETPPDRSTPQNLLRSVLDARKDARQSLGFLARAELPTAGKARLDKADEARAWRHFGMKSVGAFWARVEGAVAAGRFRVEVVDATAAAVFEVGGAAGTLTLSFEKVDGQWYLDLGK